ncbi:MAG: Exo-beta-D-glucosaminidase precursor [Lentisphaerae bacterium ADurb.BinA184]|nr:MAG: Exo-beta-D-glucosaminidase precursor [Lentisphaerae bacterium ADurb.BinA184]
MLKSLPLNGTWKVRWTDGQRGRTQYAERDHTDPVRYLDAEVPGEIHLDLMRAGLIGDPRVGVNCLAARWVEECIWSYRREFEAPAAALKAKRVWLDFRGLDLVATVVLNGQEVGRHHNSFYPCRLEVTGKLRAGRNVLAVHVEGGLFDVSDKPAEGYSTGIDGKLHKRHWLRKPQCQFSWDWSTRLINVGVTGPVTLEWTDDAVRADQFVPLAEISADLKTGALRARWFVEGLTPDAVAGELRVEVPEAGVRQTSAVTIKPGFGPVEARVEIPSPRLWWPAGHGPQHRYTVKATLHTGGRTVAAAEARVGFRHVRVNQDPNPTAGRFFILEINRRKVFVKGGNFVPADMIFPCADRARYDQLTDLALEANFNMLRIWGGGLYEKDDFYDLCDAKGLLVWQEFIFACGKYPATDLGFFEDVKREATWNVRRLASHPSLVVWCGNNEMEQGNWHWGYDKATPVYPDYGLFHLTLPRIVRDEDGTRYYQPSSPYSPDLLSPTADEVGDQHPWAIGFTNTDFRQYRQMACRFPNEGGILGPTALPTMLACLPEGQRRVQSFAWQVHDNSVDSWGEPSYPDEMVRQWIGKDVRKLSVEEFAYWAGLVQGEGLREYCENFRRRMFDTSSAIFWMYNDTWPATRSWTIADYYLRRTPAFYGVRRALRPVHVVLTLEGDAVNVYGVNETEREVRGTLSYGVFKLAGAYPFEARADVALPPNASTVIASFPAAKWTAREASMAFAELAGNDRLIARNRLFTPLFREMKWPKARVSVRLEKGEAVFSSRTFAWGICLDLDGEALLPDNFFDVYPGRDVRLPWPGRRPPHIRFVGNLA